MGSMLYLQNGIACKLKINIDYIFKCYIECSFTNIFKYNTESYNLGIYGQDKLKATIL